MRNIVGTRAEASVAEQNHNCSPILSVVVLHDCDDFLFLAVVPKRFEPRVDCYWISLSWFVALCVLFSVREISAKVCSLHRVIVQDPFFSICNCIELFWACWAMMIEPLAVSDFSDGWCFRNSQWQSPNHPASMAEWYVFLLSNAFSILIFVSTYLIMIMLSCVGRV